MANELGDRAATLCNAAKDVTRNISVLIDDLNLRHHPHRGAPPMPRAEIERQIGRVRDQIELLRCVVDDIARLEHASPA